MSKFLSLICLFLAAFTLSASDAVIPPALKPGDKIAIVTPAYAIAGKFIDGMANTLRSWGYTPVVMPHAYESSDGLYAASDSKRAEALMQAFADPEIKAIICSRGGYGTNRIIPLLDAEVVKANPKWVVGYSDVTILHSWLDNLGIASVHGPMGEHLTVSPADASSLALKKLFAGGHNLSYAEPSHKLNRPGSAQGRMLGGNFIVANNLAGTGYDPFDIADGEDVILYIEEVGEKIYAVERMLVRLHQSGALSRVKGIVFGEFIGYSPDASFRTMEAMINQRLNEWGYSFPVAYNFPFGHGKNSYPIVNGADARLTVTDDSVTLQFL